jgi:hypothetical protein
MPDRLNPGDRLMPEDLLTSQNARYNLIMQRDGNLVLRRPDGTYVDTNTASTANWNSYAVLENDGNLAVYNPAGGRTWESGTRRPGVLILQNDGSITIGADILV